MKTIAVAVYLHIGAGTLWVLSSLAVSITRQIARWLVVLQAAVALIVVLAGAYLWHALHAGRDGTTEHLLAVGTLCAFVGFGLQIGTVAPAFLNPACNDLRLRGGGLAIYRLGTLFLVLAAAAMVGSR